MTVKNNSIHAVSSRRSWYAMAKLLKCSIAGLVVVGLVGESQGFSDEPQSSFNSNNGTDDNTVLHLDPDGLTLSTTETPNPDCPDDTPVGDPDYYWDYGTLDADPDSTPGSLIIQSDVAVDYDVTVYCTQDFTDSNGNTYTEQTLTSNPG